MKRLASWDFLLLGVAIAIAYRASFSFRLMGDASLLIEHNQQMYAASNWWHILTSDYFEASNAETIGYWRPLTKGSWLLETLVGGGAHWVYRVVQVAWLIVASIGVQQLALAFGVRRGWALAAGLFFGLHPALVEAVCLVQARSDLVCGAGVIWALLGWLHWQRGQKLGLLTHVVAASVAITSKETAIILPLIVLVWASLHTQLTKPCIRNLILALCPVSVILVLYLVLRSVVLQRSVGTALNLSPVHLLTVAGAYAQGLLPLPFSSTIRNLSPAEVSSAWCIARGVLAVSGFIALCGLAWRYCRFGLGLAVWASASLLLVILPARLNVPGAREMVALSDRWLLHAVAATAVALAVAGQAVLKGRIAPAAGLLGCCWSLLSIALGPTLQADYKDAAALLESEDRDYLATPENYRSEFATCRFVERGLVKARLQRNIEQVLILARTLEQRHCSMSTANHTILTALVQAGDLSRARIYADRILARRVRGRRLRSLPWIGFVLLNTGDPQRAIAVLEEAKQRERDSCPIVPLLASARAQVGELLPASMLFEEAYRCAGPGADAQWLVSAAELALKSGDRARAQLLLDALNRIALPDALSEHRQRLGQALH